MTPIVRRGSGITGAIRYVLGEGHDRPGEELEIGEGRVAWVGGQNHGFAIAGAREIDIARRVMEFTALHGQASKTRKVEQDCYHLILSWRDDEKPSREEMEKAAKAALAEVGLERNPVMWGCHTDTAHLHLHIVASTIDPETGLGVKLQFDQLRLSRWAEQYEREHGEIQSPQRAINNERRYGSQWHERAEPVFSSGADKVRYFDRASFEAALRDRAREALWQSVSRADADEKLAELGARIEPTARGGHVVTDGKHHLKLSDVAASLKKLEKAWNENSMRANAAPTLEPFGVANPIPSAPARNELVRQRYEQRRREKLTAKRQAPSATQTSLTPRRDGQTRPRLSPAETKPRPSRQLAWKSEAQRRQRERENLKFDLSMQRRLVRALTPPGFRFITLALHRHLIADRRWSELKQQQTARWTDILTKLKAPPHAKPPVAAPQRTINKETAHVRRDFTGRRFDRTFGRFGSADQPHLAGRSSLAETQSLANLRQRVRGGAVARNEAGGAVLLPTAEADGLDNQRAGRPDALRRLHGTRGGERGFDVAALPASDRGTGGEDQRGDHPHLRVTIEPLRDHFMARDTNQAEIREALFGAGGKLGMVANVGKAWIFDRDPSKALQAAGISTDNREEPASHHIEAAPPDLPLLKVWQDLPGLDTRTVSAAEKAALKTEYDIRWDKENKIWTMPADHPKAAIALEKYGDAARPSETKPTPTPPSASITPAPGATPTASRNTSAWYELPGLDTRQFAAQEKAALKAEYGLTWNKERKRWQSPAHHPLAEQARANWGELPQGDRAAKTDRPEPAAGVIGRAQLWKAGYRQGTKENIAREIAARSNDQLMADIAASREAAKTATDDVSRKAYFAGTRKLEEEAVKRGLVQPQPATSALKERSRAEKGWGD